jgi:hypothetical protein
MFAEDRVVKFAMLRDKSENDNQSANIAQENHDTDVILGPPFLTLDDEINCLRSPRDKRRNLTAVGFGGKKHNLEGNRKSK